MKHAVLDHGYVEFIEAWGCGRDNDREREDYERGSIEAARQSTQGSFRGWDKDQQLLAYLFNSKPQHATPFEFAGMTIEVQLPIFVVREWHRHRTQSYNEMSARYAPVPSNKYVPTMERLMQVNDPSSNKQAGGSADVELTAENAMKWLALLDEAYRASEIAYQFGLQVGVAKELARCPMPVGNYPECAPPQTCATGWPSSRCAWTLLRSGRSGSSHTQSEALSPLSFLRPGNCSRRPTRATRNLQHQLEQSMAEESHMEKLASPLTGLTNFTDEQLPLYEKAIAQFGDPGLFIERRPIDGFDIRTGSSLHYRGKKKSLMKFWKLCDRLRKQDEEAKGSSHAKLPTSEPDVNTKKCFARLSRLIGNPTTINTDQPNIELAIVDEVARKIERLEASNKRMRRALEVISSNTTNNYRETAHQALASS